jgi:predicted SAM-dependent methyltransferase
MLPLLSKFPYIRRLLIKLKILSINYETSWPDIKLVDIRHKLPLKDKSVDYIYCSHVLEHFEKYETLDILKDCYRVLKKGGVIRVVLPDLKKMIKNYKSAEKFNRDFFGYEKDKKSLLNLFVRGHHWMYDENSISELMKKFFIEVEIQEFQKGEVPDLKKLDLEMHKDHSLYIEAVK